MLFVRQSSVFGLVIVFVRYQVSIRRADKEQGRSRTSKSGVKEHITVGLKGFLYNRKVGSGIDLTLLGYPEVLQSTLTMCAVRLC